MKPLYHENSQACNAALSAVRDSLYVIGGKWKLPIIIALLDGPQRFRELQRSLHTITPKVLSKELKELELNSFVTRTVYPTTPVTVEYQLTAYSDTLKQVLTSLKEWGEQHRNHLRSESKKAQRIAAATLQK
jgi:DNA-binding HxlR family transcriptional regulator